MDKSKNKSQNYTLCECVLNLYAFSGTSFKEDRREENEGQRGGGERYMPCIKALHSFILEGKSLNIYIYIYMDKNIYSARMLTSPK